jgi:hypothetical protein
MGNGEILIYIACIIAIGRFLDEFHFHNRLLNHSRDLMRVSLIHIFVTLDELQLHEIARTWLRWTFKLRWISLALSLVFLITFHEITYEILPKSPTLFFYLFIGLSFIAIQWIIFSLINTISTKSNDFSCAISLVISLLIVILLTRFMMTSVSDISNNSGLYASITMFLFVFSSVIPYSTSLLFILIVLAAKLSLVTARFIMMHISDKASSEKNDPFQYLSTMTAILIMIYELAMYIYQG